MASGHTHLSMEEKREDARKKCRRETTAILSFLIYPPSLPILRSSEEQDFDVLVCEGGRIRRAGILF